MMNSQIYSVAIALPTILLSALPSLAGNNYNASQIQRLDASYVAQIQSTGADEVSRPRPRGPGGHEVEAVQETTLINPSGLRERPRPRGPKGSEDGINAVQGQFLHLAPTLLEQPKLEGVQNTKFKTQY
ncbi:hypothetical protein [Anabaena sp. CCY 9910]|uniref:hypothetical protein n=1 Tax=Anabaena sp. CCY 9910 TaxID=3103870 RepID=UPI0039E1F8C3